jgi:hypothetical protein
VPFMLISITRRLLLPGWHLACMGRTPVGGCCGLIQAVPGVRPFPGSHPAGPMWAGATHRGKPHDAYAGLPLVCHPICSTCCAHHYSAPTHMSHLLCPSLLHACRHVPPAVLITTLPLPVCPTCCDHHHSVPARMSHLLCLTAARPDHHHIRPGTIANPPLSTVQHPAARHLPTTTTGAAIGETAD